MKYVFTVFSMVLALFIYECSTNILMSEHNQITKERRGTDQITETCRKNDKLIEECNAGEGTWYDRTVDLPKGKKLITAQAGEERGDIWYLVEDMEVNYEPKTYILRESTDRWRSEITITIVEHR